MDEGKTVEGEAEEVVEGERVHAFQALWKFTAHSHRWARFGWAIAPQEFSGAVHRGSGFGGASSSSGEGGGQLIHGRLRRLHEGLGMVGGVVAGAREVGCSCRRVGDGRIGAAEVGEGREEEAG